MLINIKKAYKEFLASPLYFHVKLRRFKSQQIQKLLSDPSNIDVDTFNKEIWVPESKTVIRGETLKSNKIFNLDLTSEEAQDLENAFKNGEIEIHGNHSWGTGSRVYAPSLQDESAKLNNIQNAVKILNDNNLTPIQKATSLKNIYGFGKNISTGLVMMFHPKEFSIFNEQARSFLKTLGLSAKTLQDYQKVISNLAKEVNAQDFLEFDWFLYLVNQGKFKEMNKPSKNFWWVNQGRYFNEERTAGCISAPKDKGGKVYGHWLNVSKVHPGDIVFHYSKGNLVAISTAISEPKVVPASTRNWGTNYPDYDEIYLTETNYTDLAESISLAAIPEADRINETDGPFDKTGGVKQGYLFPISSAFANKLMKLFPEINQILHGGEAYLMEINFDKLKKAIELQAAPRWDGRISDGWELRQAGGEKFIQEKVLAKGAEAIKKENGVGAFILTGMAS